ncbi:unnamed protein product [Cylicocyclus nassatus]|uniref:Secreted protein n=1 Tax=Cylicocyclus nassatus TaxID=53992 RepID=A0AA36DPK5_CYLNA|nr:unnamed protein product [Cylicocyclus nassatus]
MAIFCLWIVLPISVCSVQNPVSDGLPAMKRSAEDVGTEKCLMPAKNCSRFQYRRPLCRSMVNTFARGDTVEPTYSCPLEVKVRKYLKAKRSENKYEKVDRRKYFVMIVSYTVTYDSSIHTYTNNVIEAAERSVKDLNEVLKETKVVSYATTR